MAMSNVNVSIKPPGVSFAELRSKFQSRESLPVKSSPPPRQLRNDSNDKLPSTPATLPKPSQKVIRCSSNDIAAVKSKLNKINKSPPAEDIKPECKEEKDKVDESSVKEGAQEVPKPTIKPNRSHLSTLIVEVQQKCCSETQALPPPLPPWPTLNKNSKVQVRLKNINSTIELGPPPSIPFRPPNVNLKTSKPPLPQRNSDRSSNENVKSSSSPIPEYTEEQELGGADSPDELYWDADVQHAPSVISTNSSVSSNHQSANGFDELYHDASNPNPVSDEVYEDISHIPPSSKVVDVEFEKLQKKRLKEAEKRRKEIQKSIERFGLSGNEVKVDVGIVKEDTRRKRKVDLQARAGERISILKIFGTPVGKWLVRNYEGEVGYMDINNIEVNADSVRYVMRQSKTMSLHIADPESLDLYVDGNSEAIYEEFS